MKFVITMSQLYVAVFLLSPRLTALAEGAAGSATLTAIGYPILRAAAMRALAVRGLSGRGPRRRRRRSA
ncbi:hypothetical protein [Nonomuraea aridisoli]|uniref:hypothetical protein n=1 Tax=Nonomuraea aridisoli TaxID=2070368 RepID=UPI0011B94561|nr:hypothetical protein [Nonomuraea aridisoli]